MLRPSAAAKAPRSRAARPLAGVKPELRFGGACKAAMNELALARNMRSSFARRRCAQPAWVVSIRLKGFDVPCSWWAEGNRIYSASRHIGPKRPSERPHLCCAASISNPHRAAGTPCRLETVRQRHLLSRAMLCSQTASGVRCSPRSSPVRAVQVTRRFPASRNDLGDCAPTARRRRLAFDCAALSYKMSV
jgi:hypothetical protein